MSICAPWAIGLSEHDRGLLIVPMFHANGWGIPYAGWMAGSDFLMPGCFLQAEPLCRMIRTWQPTMAAAVPTVLTAALRYADEHNVDCSCFRVVFCGGAALPRSLAEGFLHRHGVSVDSRLGPDRNQPGDRGGAASARLHAQEKKSIGPPRREESFPALSFASATATRFFPGMANRSANSKRAAHGSRHHTSAILRRIVFTMDGCAPAIWAPSTSAAMRRSPTDRRT